MSLATRSEAQNDDLKRRLAAAARDILEREGLAALSLRGAARACGVSHMAPYRHFASKDDLLAAVAQQGFEALTAVLDAAAATPDGPASLEVGIAYILFACDNPSLYRLMLGPSLQPCDRFPNLIAAGKAAFARCIAIVRAHGHDCADAADGEAPAPVATAMWSLVHGLSSLAIDGLIPLPEAPAQKRQFIAQVLVAAMAGLSRSA